MDPTAAIASALFEHLKAFGQSRNLRVSRANRSFTAKDGETYLRESFIPNTADRRFIGSDDPHRYLGLYQIDVITTSGSGEQTARTLAGEIAAHFAVDQRLMADGITTRITRRADVGPMMVEDARAMIPLTLEWECFA
ncbi:hypothetical protein DYI37_03115 [Fulvimarina endophytica]|uniref:DUF3168 domain-containing protein n=1 Tax=Fulvimarina endophytica TaxID=2293836 RepID=A0A371XB25_9HYPH|nr:phage tail terminator-like protein [Fulvimarina endophytica]RFC66448.1 hypothetical protein DYI37_03115 [Fulvimarina endophytica]